MEEHIDVYKCCFASSGSNPAGGTFVKKVPVGIYVAYMGIYAHICPHMGAIYNYIALKARFKARYYRGISSKKMGVIKVGMVAWLLGKTGDVM